MDLLILESPNKVKDVKKYAGSLGFSCAVIATSGHLLDLPPMADGPSVDIATMAPSKLQPRDPRAAEQCARIKDAICHASRVIVATDPDREGEAIAAQVWPWIPKGKAWRATFEEITQAGIKRGLDAMQPKLHDSAVDAALARRVVDRLAGWHATSVVFEKLRRKGVSAGRLQSAALRLVVDRYRENTAFVASSTYGVRIRLRTSDGVEFTARLLGADNTARVFSTRAEAEASPKPKTGVVRKIEAIEKQQRPKPPFEATSWLQVAQKALGLSVKDATAVIQALFETGHTTYPRTDTVRVSQEAIEWAREEISLRIGPSYLPAEPWQHKDRGDAIQGAHEAIRPTLPHEPGDLQRRQEGQWAAAYRLIEARFLASQAAARIVQQTTAWIEADGRIFQATGQVELFAGWKRLLATDAEEESEKPEKGRGDVEDETGSLPPLAQDQTLQIVSCDVQTISTKPKPLFSQAALVAELKRLGIGRPSTYPTIVPLLLSRGWVTEKAPIKKTKSPSLSVLVPEPVAFDLADFLSSALPGLVDPTFTASLEAALDNIESGKRPRLQVVAQWWDTFEHELLVAKALPPKLPERKDLGPCPKCQAEGRTGHLRLIKGSNRTTQAPYEFAGCDARSDGAQLCDHTAPVENGELQKLASCPECSAPMRPVRRKDGGHSWLCAQHGWFLAGQGWEIIQAPHCPNCDKPMTHRERSNVKGSFFWACFEHRVFIDSSVFGDRKPSAKSVGTARQARK
jgi:DNA topoisomerase-1